MGVVPVVVMLPLCEHLGAFARVVVGPLSQRALDEALGFAVGLWAVRPLSGVSTGRLEGGLLRAGCEPDC